MFRAETKLYLVFSLSNDPGKKGSNFLCYGAISSPLIVKFSFLHRECVNLQKGSLRNEVLGFVIEYA